jgi:VWFA-related protein
MARQLIESLGPTDLACLLFVLNQKSGQDFTTDKTRLLAAVERFNGTPDRTWDMDRTGKGSLIPVLFDRFSQTVTTMYRLTVGAIGEVSAQLSALPERRKALMFISTGLPFDPEELTPRIVRDSGDSQAVMRQLVLDLQETLAAAGRANVNVYALDPGGLRAPYDAAVASGSPANPGELNRQFLKTVAESTGGFAVVNTNDAAPGIRQALDENASYYLLGYVSSNARAEGRSRTIAVRVNRPGLTVRTRNGYFEPKAAKPTTTARPASTPAPVEDAMAGILPKRDIPLQVAVAPFAVPGGQGAAVAIVLRVEQPAPAERTVEEIEVVARAFATDGAVKGSVRQTARLVLRPGAGTTADYEVLSRIDLKPGRYSLRLGAQARAAGTTGGIYCDLDVPDFAKKVLSLSGVVLNVSPGRAAAPKDLLASLIPVVPTTVRNLYRGDTVTAFVRVYQGGNEPSVLVDTIVRIVDGAGKVASESVVQIPAARFEATGRTATPRAADWTVALPLSALQAGPHLLTLEATAGKNTVRRHVRFSTR